MAIKSVKKAIEEDPLIKQLLRSKNKRVEIIAFGLSYTGVLKKVDADDGAVIITDGENQAMIEIERIESVTVLE